MKKIILVIIILGIALVGGYFLFGGEKSSDSGEELDENESDVTTEEESEDGEASINEPIEPSVKEFSIVAKQFSFEPSTITVKVGDKVKLTVESIDVAHGISIPDFEVNEILNPGEEKIIEFTADKAGTFGMFCSVVCGSGHADMKGALMVEE